MPKPKPTAEQKRAKNIRDAKIIQWIYLAMFAASLVMLFVECRSWIQKPGIPTALGVLSACGLLLASAFGRADAKETIWRGGEEVKSFGAQLSIFLTITCHFLKETALPVTLWPWVLAFYVASFLLASVCLTLYLRSIRRKRSARYFFRETKC